MRKILTAVMVAFQFAVTSAWADTQDHPIDPTDKHKPIALKCPRANGGVFELLSKNEAGQMGKLVAVFRDAGKTQTVDTIEYFRQDSSAANWERLFWADIHKKNNRADKITIGKALRLINPIMLKVCNGTSKQKDSFAKYLRGNEAKLQSKP